MINGKKEKSSPKAKKARGNNRSNTGVGKKAQLPDNPMPHSKKSKAHGKAPSPAPKNRTPTKKTPQASRTRQPTRRLSPQERRRLEQRRRNIKRAKRRRNLFVLSGLLVLSLVVFVCLSFTVLFKATGFSVSGSTRYSVEQIKNATGIKENTVSLFRIDLENTARKVETNLPYIGSVKIKRRLPETLVIYVTETKAEYAAQFGSGFLLLNNEGKILEPSSESKKLVILKCPEPIGTSAGSIIRFENEKTLNNFKTVVAALKKSELKDITQLDITDNLNLTLTYQNRIVLKIGTTADIESKFKLAVSSLANENEISREEKGTLNLTIKGKAYFSAKKDE